MQWLNRLNPKSKNRRVVKVGWVLDPDTNSTFIYDSPARFGRTGENDYASDKAVHKCPAVLDFERRLFVVPCPVDLSVRILRRPDGAPFLSATDDAQVSIAPDKLDQLIHLMPDAAWRHPDHPVIQFSTPYRFVADVPVYINQVPPYLDFPADPWPGVLISGRFPLHLWPRRLMWAFEWFDTDKPLIFKRGQPWFYVQFETETPGSQIRMVEAEFTTELERFCRGLDGVTNYVNQTFSLFQTARKRRPAQLLVERKVRPFPE